MLWCVFEPAGFSVLCFVSFPGFPGYCEVGAAHTLCCVSFPWFAGYCEVDAAHIVCLDSFAGFPGYCGVDAAHIIYFVMFVLLVCCVLVASFEGRGNGCLCKGKCGRKLGAVIEGYTEPFIRSIVCWYLHWR